MATVTAGRIQCQTFAGSQPLQEFLLYIIERTLVGSADEIKEQTIGSEVLRRTGNFDPASDNIVSRARPPTPAEVGNSISGRKRVRNRS